MRKILTLLLCFNLLISCSSSSDSNSITLPVLTTNSVTNITATEAISGGNISSDGGAAITVRGIVWNTLQNPTIDLTTKTTNGIGIGAFASTLIGLTESTHYYLRAYATNSFGTAYGNQVEFTTGTAITTVTDIDGNIYNSILICNQTWTQSNLNVSKYRDGTVIPQVTDPTQWVNLTTGAWCYYNNDINNGTIYGKLYNWYAVAGIYDAASLTNPALRKQLAPSGWHIPTDSEFTTLTTCLGGVNLAGGKMKETGIIHWTSPNTDATNESGFTCLPGGYHDGSSGSFNYIGDHSYLMSSSEFSTTLNWSRRIRYFDAIIGRASYDKTNGASVRCVKD